MLKSALVRSQLAALPQAVPIPCTRPATLARCRRPQLHLCQAKNNERGPEAPQAAAQAAVDTATVVTDDEPDAMTCVASGLDSVTCFLDGEGPQNAMPMHGPCHAMMCQYACHAIQSVMADC